MLTPPEKIRLLSLVSFLVRLFALAMAYFCIGQLGAALAMVDCHVTLVWLPTGIAVAGLFRWGLNYWLGVWLGAFAIHYAVGYGALVAMSIASGNTLAAIVTVVLLRHWHFNYKFSSWRQVPIFILSIVLGMVISASLGVVALRTNGLLANTEQNWVWLEWWLGNIVGAIVGGMPFISFDRTEFKQFFHSKSQKCLLISLFAILWVGLIWTMCTEQPLTHIVLVPLAVLVLVWTALKHGTWSAAVAAFMLSAYAAVALTFKQSFDGYLTFAELWEYMTALSVVGMIVSAFTAERKQLEETLRRSEAKFRTLFDSTADAVFLLDKNSLFDCNNATLTLFGCATEAEFRACQPTDLYPPTQPCGTDSGILAREKMRLAMKKGSLHFEWLCKRKDTDEVFPADVLLSSMVLDEKPVLQATVRDITERKKTEEKLHILSVALDQGPVSIAITDLNANLLYVNSKFTEVTGYSFEEAVGKNPRILHSGLTPSEVHKQLWLNLTQGQAWQGELINKRKNDEFYWEDAYIAPVKNSSGAITHYVGVKIDITERKQTEKALQSESEKNLTLLRNASDGIHILDAEGKILELSDSFSTMLGYQRVEMLGMNVGDWDAKFSAEECLHAINLQLTKPERSLFETLHRRKDGTMIDVEVSGFPVELNGERVLFNCARDISLRKQNERYELFRNHILELLVGDNKLNMVLEAIVRGVERLKPDMLCSILMLDEEGKHLVNGVAPSLPDFYNAAINGIDIGIGAGSCGTAAFIGETIIVEDITTHPFWVKFKALALQADLRSCWSHPILSSTNQVLGTFAIYHHQPHTPEPADITFIEQLSCLISIAIERKRMEEKLRNNEAFISSILDSLPAHIAVLNSEGVIIAVNQSWRNFADANDLPKSRQYEMGRHYFDGYQRTYQSEEYLKVRNGITSVLNGTLDSFKMAYDCSAPNQQRWFYLSVFPLKGNQQGVVVSHENITERKLLEEKIRFLFEYSPIGFALTDLKSGQFIEVNSALYQNTGYSKDEFLTLSFWDLTPREYDDLEQAQLLSLRSMGRYGPYEKEYKRKDGSRYPVLLNGVLMHDSAGHELVWSIVEDITIRKQAETQLKQAKEKAIAASLAKSEFLANMSHEIRTPMNAVLGFSDILSNLIQDSTQLYYLNAIKTSGKTLLQLINDILDLSKIEAGKLTLNCAPCQIKTIFDDIYLIFSQKMTESNVNLTIEIAENVPAVLKLDEIRLRQILLNLLGNASKFTKQGFIYVSVIAQPTASHQYLNLIIAVEDSGMGIAQDQLETIFLAFTQQEKQGAHYGGTGLGLTICKRLIEIMKGTISVRSQLGKGSCFTVTLPDIEIGSEIEAQLSVEKYIVVNKLHFQPAKILLVDDNAMNRLVIRAYLRDYPELEVIEADSGKRALELLQQYRFDLIFMDRIMPDEDGDSVCKKIKSNPEFITIPIIMISASILNAEQMQSTWFYQLQLNKPVAKTELLQAMQQFLPIAKDNFAETKPLLTKLESFSAEETLSFAQKQALLALLNAHYQQEITRLSNSKIIEINILIETAEQLQEIAEQYHYRPLNDWATTLKRQTELFELKALPKTLKNFQAVLAQLAQTFSS